MTVCTECGGQPGAVFGGWPGGWYTKPHIDIRHPGKVCPGGNAPAKPPSQNEGAVEEKTSVRAQPKPGRVFLNGASVEEDIAKWLQVVEVQTGKKIRLEGDFQCVAEEIGEMVEAKTIDDREDALCDAYVATTIADLLLKRDGYEHNPSILPGADNRSCLEILVIFSGRLGAFCRANEVKKQSQAPRVFDSLITAKAGIKREVARMGRDWNVAIGKVLDELDRRLQTGYTMSADGSAMKNTTRK